MSEDNKEEQKLAFGPSEYERLENEFKKIIDELAGDQSLDKFRIEYEKLYRALKTSYDNEKKLLTQLKTFNDELVNGAQKVQQALKFSQDDSQTIACLKQELEKTYKVLELSKDREEKGKAKIENLHTEIKHLTEMNEKGQDIDKSQNENQQILQKEIQALKEEIMQYNQEMASQNQQINVLVLQFKQNECDTKVKNTEKKEQLKQLLEMQEKLKKDDDRKKKMDDEKQNLKKQLDEEERKKVEKQKQIDDLKQEIINKNMEISQKGQQLKQTVSDLAKRKSEFTQLRRHFEQRNEQKREMSYRKLSYENEIKALELQKTSVKSKLSQLEKQYNKLINRKQQLTQQLDTADRMKKVAITSVSQLDRQVQDAKKMNTEDKDQIKELEKAKKQLEQNLAKTVNVNKVQADEIIKNDNEIIEKDKEIIDKKKELDKLQKQIIELEKEKERYGKQAAQANAKYFHSLEEIKLKDNLISEFQKKNVETEAKLKQQQSLYEAVRSDRNLYSKNLSETQDEIAEIKRRYKIVNHQISQLKEESDAKEVALAKEHFEHKKKDKTIEEHSRILEQYRKNFDEKGEKIKNFVGEIGKLHYIIKDSEQIRQKLKEDYEVVVADRDILGTQLIRRNDESALLYEKIKIQQKTLANGESAYRERLGDIELLRYKIADLMRALKIYRKQVDSIPRLKNEIHNLQKELIEEKLRVKALSEELENPLNAHRCRKLPGDDPDIYEQKQKLSTLQRRLIQKTEQVVEKEVLIQQKEKQIQEYRDIMKKQPGIEEAKKLSNLSQSLKTKTRQMKALAAELNMHQAQINEFKYDIEKLNKELQETKRKYYELRRREQQEKLM